jgi:hypothetical protein
MIMPKIFPKNVINFLLFFRIVPVEGFVKGKKQKMLPEGSDNG